jgi:hypothetical protein
MKIAQSIINYKIIIGGHSKYGKITEKHAFTIKITCKDQQ